MSALLPPVTFAHARRWADADPDPDTRAELLELVRAEDGARIAELMEPPVAFGTAGIRAVVGAGAARMNRAVVRRIAAALSDHLLARVPDARALPVVIGYDARPTSRGFAEEFAGVLSAARFTVRYFAEAVPTPLVAYAQKQMAGAAGVVITASHNPPEYNGCKIYGPGGIQLGAPDDADVARRLARIGPAASIPCVARVFADPARAERVPDAIIERYLGDVDALRPPGDADRSLSIVYTPLHGVGGRWVTTCLSRAGFDRVLSVPEQAEPDGRFPTVSFPNPEEPGALDLAERLAAQRGADLVLANDPDADRLAVSVPTASGRWVRLTGNQIGLLLGEFILASAPASPVPLVVSTVVSSAALGAVAEAMGARFVRTLTGFKWIAGVAAELERTEGVRFVFGYEEAIGYCAGKVVADKDGVSAALLFAELTAQCRAQGQSVRERLSALYQRHGLWTSAQATAHLTDPAGASVGQILDRVATALPSELAGAAVRRVTDFRAGAEGLPATPLMRVELEGGTEALIRPSGTEPKLKIYVNARGAPAPAFGPEEQALLEHAAAVAAAVKVALGLA